MSNKTALRNTLLTGLILISLGGWLLHLRIHTLESNRANFLPFIAGIISVVVVPWLLARRNTVHLGYLLNGIIVILGTILMAHYSIAHLSPPLNFKTCNILAI